MIDIRVPFADTDAMGIVHHANYLKYFEIARVGWLRERGLDYRDWQKNKINMPLVEATCRYRRPARFEDVVEVTVKAELVSPMRVLFTYEIKNKDTEELLTTGSTTHVAVNETMKVIPLPENFLKALENKGSVLC